MKSRKGFTLVELLGAIVILSLLSLVAIPVVTNVVKENKQKLYDIQLKNIESAAKAWGSDNLSSLPDSGESTTISLEQLQKAGYVEKDIKDPKTGKALENIVVTICNINNQYTYTTDGKCDIPEESNTSLKSLTVNGKDVLATRQITLPIGTTSIEINATAVSSKATITGIGTKEVKEGKNNFSIIVTAEDESKTSYDIEVIITAASTNANLSKLGLTNCTLNPTFSGNTIKYTCTVDNSVTETVVSATASDSNATITGLGTKKLNVGTNQIDVVVTAQNSSIKKTYSIYVTRKKSNDATLKSLSVSGCTLSPTFSGSTTAYTCTVDNSVESVSVSATANNSKATVTGTGTKSLNVGENTISVKATAEDGTTTKTYTVTVTRKEPLDSDTSLKTVAINGSEKVYILPNGTTTAKIQARATSEKSTVTIEGIVDEDTTSSAYFVGTITGLKTGSNEIKVKVVAQNGDEEIHTITVTVAGSTLLKNLTASDDCTLSPTFSGSTTSYTCTVGRDTSSINISATPIYSKAKVKGTGNVNLSTGENKINVEVTAEDNISRTYTITVNKTNYTSESCFEFDKNTNTITGYNCDYTEISIPEKINNYAVTKIGTDAFNSKNLTSLTLPNTITNIDSSAFMWNDLTNLVIPESVLEIGSEAFKHNKLKNVSIPSTTKILSRAFNDNQLPDSQAYFVTKGDTKFDNKLISYGGANRNDITIPDNIGIIGEYAFDTCDLTGNLFIPDDIRLIDSRAFWSNQLQAVYFLGVSDDSWLEIGESAFASNNINTVLFGYNLQDNKSYPVDENIIIENSAFKYNNISNLELNIYGQHRIDLESESFSNNDLTEIKLINSSDSKKRSNWIISSKAFFKSNTSNSNLKTIYNDLDRKFDWNNIISGNSGKTEFIGCPANEMKDSCIVNDVKIIKTSTSDLDKFTYEFTYQSDSDNIDGVKITGFKDGYSETDLVIPEYLVIDGKEHTVKEIGNSAFTSKNLNSLTLPYNLKSIGDYAFMNNHLTSLPDVLEQSTSSVQVGVAAFNDNLLPDDEAFIHGSASSDTVVSYGGERRDNVTIPSNITIISAYAFFDCDIKSITIPEGVTKIGAYAFSNAKSGGLNSGLIELSIPSTIIYIGRSAFEFNSLDEYIYNNSSLGFQWNKILGSSNTDRFPEGIAYKIDGTEVYVTNPNFYKFTSETSDTGTISYSNKHVCGDEATQYGLIIPPKLNGKKVTAISERAFAEETKEEEGRYQEGGTVLSQCISTAILPDSITTIGKNAFSGNGLYSISWPANLKSIEQGAFSENNFSKVALPDTLISIGEDVFINNYRLAHIKNNNDNLELSSVLEAFNLNKNKTCAGYKGTTGYLSYDSRITTCIEMNSPYFDLAS